MQVGVFYLPPIVSRGEIEKGIADLRPDLYQQMLEELRERTPVRWLFAWTYNGLTPRDKIMRSLELFATKVPASLRGRACRRLRCYCLTRPMTLPSGSENCAIVGPSGMSIGGMTVFPPMLSALASVSSRLTTWT